MKTNTCKFSKFCKTGTITKTLSLLVIAVTLLPASCKKDKKTTQGGVYVNQGKVSTLAGSATAGWVDEPGVNAQFQYPRGIAVDQDGNVYAADTENHRIRKISKRGVVSTLAGDGLEDDDITPGGGFLDGPGAQAKFNEPNGVAVDAQGNVYVADSYNNRIRKITQLNEQVMVSTLAGTGNKGFNDGARKDAEFSLPYGIAIDAKGIIYVAEIGNDRIRKIVQSIQLGIPTTLVSTLAGGDGEYFLDATGTAAKFKNPCGIAVDAQGTIYVADTDNARIRKIDPVSGKVTTLAGSGDQDFLDATGTAAKFYFPYGVAVDAQGTIYVADARNNRIRKIDPASGKVTTLAGDGLEYDDITPGGGFRNGLGAQAKFNDPRGVAVDKDGKVYVADTGNSRIRKIE